MTAAAHADAVDGQRVGDARRPDPADLDRRGGAFCETALESLLQILLEWRQEFGSV